MSHADTTHSSFLSMRTAQIAGGVILVLLIVGAIAYAAWPAPEEPAVAALPPVPMCDPGEPALILPYPGPNGARHTVRTSGACMSRLFRIPDGVEWNPEPPAGGIVHVQTWSGRQLVSADSLAGTWHGNIDNLAFRLWGDGPVTIVLRRKAPVAEGIVQAAFPSSPRPVRSTVIDVEPVCDTAHTYQIPVPESRTETSMVSPIIMEDPACWTGVVVTPREFARGFALAETETTVEIALPDGQRFALAPNGTWEFTGQQAFRVKGSGKLLVSLLDRTGGSGANTASALPVSRRPRDPENEKVLSWLLPDRRP